MKKNSSDDFIDMKLLDLQNSVCPFSANEHEKYLFFDLTLLKIAFLFLVFQIDCLKFN